MSFSKSLGLDLAADEAASESLEAVRIGQGTIFEAQVVKGRSLGGLSRKRSFEGYVQELKAQRKLYSSGSCH